MEQILAHIFIELIVALQGIVPGILWYKLITHNYSKKVIISYFLIVLWFILLKYHIIYFKVHSVADYIAWGIYNIWVFVIFIKILVDIKAYKSIIEKLKNRIKELEYKLSKK